MFISQLLTISMPVLLTSGDAMLISDDFWLCEINIAAVAGLDAVWMHSGRIIFLDISAVDGEEQKRYLKKPDVFESD